MKAIYQVKNNNKQVELYANLTMAKCKAQQYLAERIMAKEPNSRGIWNYNESITYIQGIPHFTLTATVGTKRLNGCVRSKTYRQNIKCPKLNDWWTVPNGTQDFLNLFKRCDNASKDD